MIYIPSINLKKMEWILREVKPVKVIRPLVIKVPMTKEVIDSENQMFRYSITPKGVRYRYLCSVIDDNKDLV